VVAAWLPRNILLLLVKLMLIELRWSEPLRLLVRVPLGLLMLLNTLEIVSISIVGVEWAFLLGETWWRAEERFCLKSCLLLCCQKVRQGVDLVRSCKLALCEVMLLVSTTTSIHIGLGEVVDRVLLELLLNCHSHLGIDLGLVVLILAECVGISLVLLRSEWLPIHVLRLPWHVVSVMIVLLFKFSRLD